MVVASPSAEVNRIFDARDEALYSEIGFESQRAGKRVNGLEFNGFSTPSTRLRASLFRRLRLDDALLEHAAEHVWDPFKLSAEWALDTVAKGLSSQLRDRGRFDSGLYLENDLLINALRHLSLTFTGRDLPGYEEKRYKTFAQPQDPANIALHNAGLIQLPMRDATLAETFLKSFDEEAGAAIRQFEAKDPQSAQSLRAGYGALAQEIGQRLKAKYPLLAKNDNALHEMVEILGCDIGTLIKAKRIEGDSSVQLGGERFNLKTDAGRKGLANLALNPRVLQLPISPGANMENGEGRRSMGRNNGFSLN